MMRCKGCNNVVWNWGEYCRDCQQKCPVCGQKKECIAFITCNACRPIRTAGKESHESLDRLGNQGE